MIPPLLVFDTSMKHTAMYSNDVITTPALVTAALEVQTCVKFFYFSQLLNYRAYLHVLLHELRNDVPLRESSRVCHEIVRNSPRSRRKPRKNFAYVISEAGFKPNPRVSSNSSRGTGEQTALIHRWMKDIVYLVNVQTREELLQRILNAAATIRNKRVKLRNATSAVHTRADRCIEIQGSIFENAHVGLAGNELADHLAKQAASNNEIPVSFDRIPVSDIMRELQEESVVKWESEWQNTINGAVTKSYFPSVKERLRVNIPLNGKVTTFLNVHGKTGAYLYRFKLRDNPSCACGAEEQTVDHLLFECPKLDKERLAFQREMLRKTGNWTFTKLKIMQEHVHTFINYVNVINLDE
ncbi:hypothetical protein ANN_09159 [Periplaneta americana]|uniref:Uncharacterized protein n=1 Tax=Periplaneta americana TaxID=6978 RepID=A0ABQ8TLI9_PERAM|nr:hypothetical protein ANN_09159 [Periplaneta americana]